VKRSLWSVLAILVVWFGTVAGASPLQCQRLLDRLNGQFLDVHGAKERVFWQVRMDHAAADSETLGTLEKEVQAFLSDPQNLIKVEAELQRRNLSRQERRGLQGLRRLFEVNTISTPEAMAAYMTLIDMEKTLATARTNLPLGYTDPETNEHVLASPKKSFLIINADPNPAVRRAAFDGLRAAEKRILDLGFIDLIKQRNLLARRLGYSDYYAYKLKTTEGLTKDQVFAVLDSLEEGTRSACKKSLDELTSEKGPEALDPWNYGYFTSGDMMQQMDPYFPPAYAFERWGRTFAALGVNYRGATIRIDLIDRAKKYNNGFMHGPSPSFVDREGFHPAEIGMTSNASLDKVGAGEDMAKTLHHEGGHAAHFSNGFMPSPAFHQEFAPTSVATAETQSMFMDSFLQDPVWLLRYAKTADGQSIPHDLLKRAALEQHRYLARELRYLLIIPFVERALYEMPEDQMTPENVLRVVRETENKLLFADSLKPAITIPHILSNISSAYYHGYVLAELAVYQTRAFFQKKYGFIVDNPRLARDLAKNYWAEGNAKTFFEFVERMTGEPFSVQATLDVVNLTQEQVSAEVDRAIVQEQEIPHFTGPVDLNATLILEHGDTVVTSNEGGKSFEQTSQEYADWVLSQTPKAKP
jgi:oligoendopeptidase F